MKPDVGETGAGAPRRALVEQGVRRDQHAGGRAAQPVPEARKAAAGSTRRAASAGRRCRFATRITPTVPSGERRSSPQRERGHRPPGPHAEARRAIG